MDLAMTTDGFINEILRPTNKDNKMPEQKNIDDLSPTEIKLLLDFDDTLSHDQLIEIKDFVERIGGIENAQEAIELLSEIEEAA